MNKQPIRPDITYRSVALVGAADRYGNPVWVPVCSMCGAIVLDHHAHNEFHTVYIAEQKPERE